MTIFRLAYISQIITQLSNGITHARGHLLSGTKPTIGNSFCIISLRAENPSKISEIGYTI